MWTVSISLYEYFFDDGNTGAQLYPTKNDWGYNKGNGPRKYVDNYWKYDVGSALNLNLPYFSYGQNIP